ncbi:hypothetical protein HN51_007570 [Arachis hypogaea]|uniref:Uncharacterized protein n=1 Tax=Arachis hypogaea TaxID=3818 RepID=A0A445D731_ARAHY|nr:uncharacterized protein DS421_5g148290 [Arachis hypogaea]RYR59087.1 hypothetical protein Ahy_A05g024931 [Arachis hypogaea]
MCCGKKRMKVLRFLLDHMYLSPEVGTYTLLVHGINSKRSHAEATAGRTRLQEHDQGEATHRGFDGTDPTQQSRY